MTRIHTAAELREIDAHAARELKVPTALLMENAGRAIAMAAQGERVFVACGKGNNGGDGWVAARHILSAGFKVAVVALGPIADLKGDARAAAEAAIACGVPVVANLDEAGKGDVVIDAIFGTGLARPAEGAALALIWQVNAARGRGASVLAVDVPSGLDADRHHPIGEHVVADRTVSLHALKTALVQFPTRAACGEVELGTLGIPSVFAPGPVRRFVDRCPVPIPARPVDAHKGTSGHVLVVAGSPGKPGAAAMACRAAFRAGAGLVTLASSQDVLDLVIGQTPEVMGIALDAITADALLAALDRKSALVIGPGIARAPHTGEVIAELLRHVAIPALIDADALNALAERSSAPLLRGARVPPVLTPHPAELGRLLGQKTEEIQGDRFAAATKAAQEFGAHVVLKGACSVVAHPDGSLEVNGSGTQALATAGTGDVLAGLGGALLSQGLSPHDVSILAPWLHGRAGEVAARGNASGLLASDVIDAIPGVMEAERA